MRIEFDDLLSELDTNFFSNLIAKNGSIDITMFGFLRLINIDPVNVTEINKGGGMVGMRHSEYQFGPIIYEIGDDSLSISSLEYEDQPFVRVDSKLRIHSFSLPIRNLIINSEIDHLDIDIIYFSYFLDTCSFIPTYSNIQKIKNTSLNSIKIISFYEDEKIIIEDANVLSLPEVVKSKPLKL